MDCHRVRGSGCRLGYGISPLGEGGVRHNPTKSCQNLHMTGEKTLGVHKQNTAHTRKQEKGEVTPQETDPDLPVTVRESPAEVWVHGGLLQGWGH